ncbi:DUF6252 family protein [Hymenobacter properus]|uniref:Lipoprotein n=1 Tax=Hymenobacter properus TaxID=2791026 RepID=A0A931FMP0_9BACT|nr:DUF6252 family protein [Hymenobacter properus]MBF9144195.1 hypothetical protein [Hymenobacter properus]MBR7723013.1 hypothetical protein [Microvirga sp. SRT04]
MTAFLHFARVTTAGLALVSLAACSSSKKEDPAPPAREIKWTVDGATQKTTTLQSQKLTGALTVSGTTPAGTTPTFLLLQFPDAVGTYTFGPSSTAGASYTSSTGGTVAAYYAGATGFGSVAGAGTIVVTALSATEVSGTFTFTGVNPVSGASKSVTNGTFNVGL